MLFQSARISLAAVVAGLILTSSSIHAQVCTTYLPDPATFPFLAAMGAVQTTSFTITPPGTTQTVATPIPTIWWQSPLDYARSAFGSESDDLFRMCNGAFQARSKSTTSSIFTGYSVTDSVAVTANGTLTVMNEIHYTQNDSACPGGCSLYDATEVRALTYDIRTGSYQLTYRHDGRYLYTVSPVRWEYVTTTPQVTSSGRWPVLQDSGACSYTLSPTSASFSSKANSGTVAIMTAPACIWNANSNDAFVSIRGASSGTGPGSLAYDVSLNAGDSARTGSLSIAGITFPIAQGRTSCSVNVQPASLAIGAEGGMRSLAISPSAEDCTWSLTNLPPWITTSTTSGRGSMTINLAIQPNATATSRSATLTLSGIAISAVQAAGDCSVITLAETSQSISPAGGNSSVLVNAPTGCAYQVSSSDPFVQVSPPSRSGTDTITFTVQPNTGAAPRIGTLVIANKPFQVRQAGAITPTISCRVTAEPAAVRSLGRTEQLADMNIGCSGPTGGLKFFADVVVVLNTAITNRTAAPTSDAIDATLAIAGGGSIAGRLEGINALRFPSVPFSSGEPLLSLAMRIYNLRADVSQLGTGQQAATITGTVSVTAPINIPISDATATLAASRNGISIAKRAVQNGNILPVILQEGFASSFKSQVAEANGGSADTPTRLLLRVTGVPATAQLFAPTTSTNNAAQLVSANSDGVGGSPVTGLPRAGGTYQQVTLVNGGATITWEITTSNAIQIDGPEFRILVENASVAQIDQIQFDPLLGPLSEIATADATAAIPRFLDPNRNANRVNLRVRAQSTSGSRPLPPISDTGTCPNCVALGGLASLTYSIANDSDQRADNVVLRTALPLGLTAPTCTPSCTVQDRFVRFNLGTLNSGTSTTAMLSARVGGVANCPNCVGNGSILQVAAGASSSQGETEPRDNQAENEIQVDAPCQFSLSKSAIGLGPQAATVSVVVTTGPACDWIPPVSSNGVTVAPAGTLRGPATLQISMPANTTAASRTIPLAIQGQTLQIVQAAVGCSFTLPPPPIVLPQAGGEFTLGVQTAANCEWRASVAPDWLMLSSPGSGTGAQTIRVNAGANALTAPRIGVVEVSGQQRTVIQASTVCSPTLASNAVTLAAGGGTGTVIVTSQAGCSWSAAASDPWITVTSTATSFTYTLPPNPGIQRVGVILAGGQAFTITQEGGGLPTGLRFVAVTPCRVMETRPEYNFEGRTGAFGPPFLQAAETRTLTMANSNICQIPASAKAYVLNATLVPRGGVDFVTIWAGGEPRPNVWSVRSPDGQIVANAAIVKAGNGAIQVYSSNPTDLLLDISGYYTDDTAAANQAFYPLTPCRVIDTRLEYRAAGPFGPPTMNGRETRRFRFPSTPFCSIPAGASAYSVTITAVPQGPLQFLTAWPAGSSQPNVSNINSPAGRVLANSVILPAAPDGGIDVFTFDRADFLIDINGYFAPDNGTGLFYFPVTPCRVSDSRNPNGAFGGPIYGGEPGRTLPLPMSGCGGIPSTAKAYAVNVTALPNGSPMPFVTAWQTGQPRPNASVLNAFQGQIVTNLAIVPANATGAIDVFAFTPTHVVVEVSGYFGR